MSRIAYLACYRRTRELERRHVIESAQPHLWERVVYFFRRIFK